MGFCSWNATVWRISLVCTAVESEDCAVAGFSFIMP